MVLKSILLAQNNDDIKIMIIKIIITATIIIREGW